MTTQDFHIRHFAQLFEQHQQKIYVQDANQTYTYQHVWNLARQRAQEWRLQISQDLAGMAIVLQSEMNCEWFIDFWALVISNAVIIPLSSERIMKEPFFNQFPPELKSCDPRYIIEQGQISKVQKIYQRGLHRPSPTLYRKLRPLRQTGLILFTSGTTSTPKAALLTLQRMYLRFLSKPQLPLKNMLLMKEDHMGGINTILGATHSGSSITIPADRSMRTLLETIKQQQIEILPMTPSLLRLLLAACEDPQRTFASTKIITYGAEAMPASLLNTANQLLPQVKWLQTYGLTETGVFNTKSPQATSLAISIRDPNAPFKIKNQQFWVKSKYGMLGYLNANTPLDAEGYFCTQDFVQWDQETETLVVLGRKNNMIHIGGEKINGLTIESVLLQHKKIEQALVQGEHNGFLGSIPVATIQISADQQQLTTQIEKELRELCAAQLPRVSQPMRYRFVTHSLRSDRYKKISKAG